MSRPTSARGAASALLATLLLAGCGGSGGLDTSGGASGSASPSTPPSASPSATVSASESPSPTATNTSAPAPASTVDPAAAAVAADWRQYRAGFVKGLHTRNERVPDLVRYATAKKQSEDRTRIGTMRARGYVFKGSPRNWIKDVAVSGSRALLRSCDYDSASYYAFAGTDRKVIPVEDKWVSESTRLIRRSGRWQVDSVAFVKFSCKGAK